MPSGDFARRCAPADQGLKTWPALSRTRSRRFAAIPSASRATHPDQICHHALAFTARLVRDGAISPGHEDRLAARRAHDDTIKKKSPAVDPSTRYSRSDNLITITPEPRQ